MLKNEELLSRCIELDITLDGRDVIKKFALLTRFAGLGAGDLMLRVATLVRRWGT